jgi:hypothetical protein
VDTDNPWQQTRNTTTCRVCLTTKSTEVEARAQQARGKTEMGMEGTAEAAPPQDDAEGANGSARVTKEKLAAAQQRLSAWKEQRNSGTSAVRVSRSLARPGSAGAPEPKTSDDAAARLPSSAELQAVDPRLKPPQLLVRRSCITHVRLPWV